MIPNNLNVIKIIRKDIEFLLCDYNIIYSFLYDKIWGNIVRHLSCNEPFIRLYILKSLISIPCFTKYITPDSKFIIELITILENITLSDEVTINRCYASVLIGKLLPIISDLNNSKRIIERIFNKLLSRFQSLYPSVLNPEILNNLNYFSNQNLNENGSDVIEMVYSLRSIGVFINTSPCLNDNFMLYFDMLLELILSSSSNKYLQIEALNIINNYYPRTNRGRLRIEHRFKEKINELSKKYELDIEKNFSKKQEFLQKIDDKYKEESDDKKNKSEENEIDDKEKINQTVDKILFNKLDSFWSIWYPIVPDKVILRIPYDQIKEGYIFYRMKYLLEQTQLEGSEDLYQYQKNKQQLKKEDVIKILKSNIKFPYPEKENCSAIDVKEIIKYIPKMDSSIPSPFNNTLKKYINEINNMSFNNLVESPYISTLSFNLKYPIILFNKYPLTRDLFLHNSSRIKENYFRIQVYPPEYFEVKPAFGIIPKNDFILVKIRFKPQPYLSNTKPEIFGYLKLRSLNGYTMERITLHAINYPSIKLSTNEIKIGYCPEGYSRDFSFYVTNLTSTKLFIAALLKDNSSSNRFIFPFESDELNPYEKKMFIGKFLPLERDKGKELYNQILVITGNGEILRLNISGICDESIKIYKKKLDFGPTDIYSSEITKTLIIENIDKYNSIPILMEASTNEIVINNGNNIVLNPSEIRKLKIKFTSYYSGYRQETIYITCPFTKMKIIDVIAHSGPSLIFPVYKEIYFPIVKINEVTVLNVPLLNMTDKQVNCIMYMPVLNNPFNFCIKTKPSILEFKGYEDKNYKGIKLKFKEKGTAIISIIFCSNICGIYKIPIMLKVDKNNSIKLNNYFLFGSAYNNEIYKTKTTNFNKYLTFYNDKSDTQILNRYEQLNKNNLTMSDNLNYSPNESSIFEIKTKKISINYNETYKNNNFKFINLFNKTNKPQKYHLIISKPFIASGPSEGMVEANTMIDIQISVKLDLIEDRNLIEDEVIIYGVLTIFDDTETHEAISVNIECTINDMINVGIRRGISGIEYPLYAGITKLSRNFILRNKSPNSIRCNIYLKKTDSKIEKIIFRNPYLNKRILEEMRATKERRSQFSQNKKTIVIKPFEVSEVEISYSLLKIRSLNVGFFIEYFTSLTDDIDIESKNLKDIQNVEFTEVIILKGYSKPPSININKTLLDFGCISDDDKVKNQLISYLNNNADKYDLLTFVSYPFSLEGNAINSLEPNNPIEIPVKYLYRKFGPQHQTLIYNQEIRTFNSLFIYGNIALCRIDVNIFKPKMAFSVDKNHYIVENNSFDFGFLPYEDTVIKTFCIRNNGSIDYIIQDINIMKCTDDNNKYKCIIEDYNPNDNFINWEENLDKYFNDDYLDKYEYDMDEKIKRFKVKEQYIDCNFEKLFGDSRSNTNNNNNNNLDTNNSETVKIERIDRIPMFPVTLKPNQKLNINLLISPQKIGKFNSNIKIISKWETMDLQERKYRLFGSIQPIIKFKFNSFDFGIIPYQSKKSITIEFKNEGSEKIFWHLKFDRTYYSIIESEDIKPIDNFEDDEEEELEFNDNEDNNNDLLFKNEVEQLSNNLHPFTVFPIKGRLKPGYTQDIEIFFNPSLPNYHYRSILNLFTENIGYSSLELKGISSGSIIQCSDTYIDFLSNRIGKTCIKYVVLKNYSLMSLNFYIEIDDNVTFSVSQDQGIIGVGEERTIKIGFTPKKIKSYKGKVKISSLIPGSNLAEYSYISLTGKGSYPELTVDNEVIDFGVTFLGYSNKASINVQNHGEPNILMKFKCYHPNIKVDPGCEDENGYIVVYANTITQIKFIYIPSVVEKLNINAFLLVVDDERECLSFNMKAMVGIPKFSIYPESICECINFGTCLINKSTKRKFTIKNEGNTILKYKIKLNINQIKYAINDLEVEREIEVDDNFKNVFYVVNSEGKLKINEEKKIILIFKPKDLYEYNYDLIFSLEYKDITIPLIGVGGRYDININIPSNTIDLGTCKVDQTFVYVLQISNNSNMGVNYHIRPEPSDGNYDIYTKEIQKLELQSNITSKENYYQSLVKYRPNSSFKISDKLSNIDHRPETAPSYGEDNKILKRSYFEKEKMWIYNLKSIGLNIVNPDGYCDQLENTDVIFQYTPIMEMPINANLRVYYGNEFKDITVVGRSANPILSLYDENHNLIYNSIRNNSNEVVTYDMGVISINTKHTTTFYLTNEGEFGVDFFIQPITINEYIVTPQSGFVNIDEKFPISIKFSPKSENVFKTNLKIFWENHVINVLIVGKGDVGKLNIYYPDMNERDEEELDFKMIPTHTSCEKSFFIINRGAVIIPITIELTNKDFAICASEKQKEFLEEKLFIDTAKKTNRNNNCSWKTYITESLLPGNYIEILVRFWAKKTFLSKDIIKIKSVNFYKEIPIKGKGGSINIQHKGDLEFGDIANNFTFKKKITIINEGTIPCNVNFEWMTLGHQVIQKNGSSHVILKDNYANHDPRSPWARNMVLKEKEKNNESSEWTAKDYWRMIKNIILYEDNEAEEENNNSKKGTKLPINADSVEKLHAEDTSKVNSFALKYLKVQFSTQVKRRKLFYKLISQNNISSQSFIRQESYLKVNPPHIQLNSYCSKDIEVEINISTDDTFLGTLICKPDVPNSKKHEISLTAVTKSVCIVCDDTSILNFFRQPVGHEETLKRTFTNVGEKIITFSINHDCPNLRVSPESGLLRINQSVTIEFTYKPVDFSFQHTIIYFQPNCSNPVRLRMCGGGGLPKASLTKFKQFDFGNCMIGKSIIGYLPIINEGTAILHLTEFVLVNNLNFFKTDRWPDKTISIYPNQRYNLELMFYPKEEKPPSGKLIIASFYESWEIELVGCGKESVIIFSKQNLIFENCIIGNSYEQKLILKNIGDVNYPLSFSTDYSRNDITFDPEDLVIDPYMEKEVIVTYTPSTIDYTTIKLKAESPYSINELPITIASGTVKLEFNMTDFDYGVFEKNTRPCKVLIIKNNGTMKTSFAIVEKNNKLNVRLSTARGIIKAGETTEIKVSLINNEIGVIDYKLLIYTDLLNDEKLITIHGVCEESIVNPEEFKLIEMGINPTNVQVIKPLIIRNYGKFPLSYTILYSYPLKVSRKIGVIDGNDEHIINVIWIPNSGYELRSTLTLETNIGNFSVLVRGKSAFPEVTINRLFIDYGVKAINNEHKESFEISNNGIVPLKWKAYQSRANPCFYISQESGSLNVNDKTTLDIYFKPTTNTKFTSSYIIECKGRSYKEINMVGIGGLINIAMHPKEYNIGKCPCYNSKEYYFKVKNTGDLPLDLTFDYERIENLQIILPNPVHIDIKENKSCKFMVLPKSVGYFKTTISIISKYRTFKYTIYGIGYEMKVTEIIKDIVYNGKNITQNYIHPWEKISKIDNYDFWINIIRSGIKNDYSIVISMIKLLQLRRSISKAKNSIDLSKDSIFDYVYRGKSENSISLTNSERSINRSRRRSSLFPSSRRTSRSTFSISNTLLTSSRKLLLEKEKESNINKARVFSFPSHEILKEKESPKSFKSNIIKMNKKIEEVKKQEAQYKEKQMMESALTTRNYQEYLVKTFDGRQVYHRNGPMINNFFKQFENEINDEYLVDENQYEKEKKENQNPKIKSILKKTFVSEPDFGRDNSNDEIENSLLVRLKQDDINNDVYMNIVNGKNEKNIKKKRYDFGNIPMIQEEQNTFVENGEEENNVQKPRLSVYFNNTEVPSYHTDNDIENNEFDINSGVSDMNRNIFYNTENTAYNSEINDPVGTESNNTLNTENDDSGRNDYDREDLLNFLNIDSKDTKNKELSNEEFKLMEERLKHDQELLTKMEYYQNILDIASISVLDMVELVENGIDTRPIIQNIIYSIQQNITFFTEDDIKNLEDMFIVIKSYKPKPTVTIKNQYDKIIEKIISVPYPKTKVHSLKELLKLEEPDIEIDVSSIISRPHPFLFKKAMYENYDSNQES